MSHCGI